MSHRLSRAVLTAAITAYRAIPGPLRKTCPRAGLSCSQLALNAVRNGAGLAGVTAIVASCAPAMGKHSPTCDFPAGSVRTCSNAYRP